MSRRRRRWGRRMTRMGCCCTTAPCATPAWCAAFSADWSAFGAASAGPAAAAAQDPEAVPAAGGAPAAAPDALAAPAPVPVGQQPLPASDVPLLRVIGQVGAAYIVAEGPDGLYL